jgi:hypothetical protein
MKFRHFNSFAVDAISPKAGAPSGPGVNSSLEGLPSHSALQEDQSAPITKDNWRPETIRPRGNTNDLIREPNFEMNSFISASFEGGYRPLSPRRLAM